MWVLLLVLFVLVVQDIMFNVLWAREKKYCIPLLSLYANDILVIGYGVNVFHILLDILSSNSING